MAILPFNVDSIVEKMDFLELMRMCSSLVIAESSCDVYNEKGLIL